VAKRTPFYQAHLQAQAKIVDFAGWDMPLHYGSQIQEHHQVRQHAGLFDVSHMGIVDLHGKKAIDYLRFLLANDVNRLTPGKALYTCMLNDKGGVIDDLIVYKIAEDFFRLVINAGTREKDIAWMKNHLAGFEVTLTERLDLVMLALQGPEIKDKLSHFFNSSEYELIQQLKPFTFVMIQDNLIARTGYTGEDGVEIIFPVDQSDNYWQRFVSLGILPCGLGARDTLRLEAGLNLYGNDMDETVTPLESGLGWTVALEPMERNFIGKQALAHQKAEGIKNRFVGLVLAGPGIIRHHQKVLINGKEAGHITSGGYSPTLEKSIGLARVDANIGPDCYVDIRNKPILAKVVKPPFVRHGKKTFEEQ
jgi:aminomethyltransferase